MRNFFLIVLLLLGAALGRAVAQDRTISGRVVDRTTNEGLPGVTVLAKGTQIGGATNADGSFSLSVPASATTLRISSVGYTAIDQPITDGPITVSLVADTKQLGEVVVTALGVQRQSKEIGYAQTTIQAEELNQARVTNVTSGLSGKVAGLQIQTLSAGINPSIRVTLRGTRSLTGDNQALIVLDGVIVPNDVLTALNPDDVASVTVLKGANSAALYGSQASNGALVITTKKGGTTPQVTFSQTSQFESLAFLPKFQKEFGPGANEYNSTLPVFNDGKVDTGYETQYQGFENQQFGPRFDGSIQPLGEVTESGNLQMIKYEARPNEKRKFFNTGYQMQNNVSFSGGDEKSKIFLSYQNVHNNGIIPKDKFDRNTFRLNASRELGKLTTGFNVSYSQKRVDATSNIDRDNSVYWNVFNTSVLVPITQYKDWRNNEFANPNGYYNAYYYNPYFIIDNNRVKNREDYIIGNIDLGYKIFDWLNLSYRIGTTNIAQSSQTTQDKFLTSVYTTNNTNHSSPGTPGFVAELSSNLTKINSDFFVNLDKTFGDISVRAILGNNVQQLDSRYLYAASTGLSVPGVFNLQNRVGEINDRLPGSSEPSAPHYRTRSYSFFGDLTLGYKDFFFVHGSGRNDWVSTLAKENRSVFYPGVDVSLVFSDAVPTLKESSFLDYGKIRAGITRVSQVNLQGLAGNPGVAQSGGAYVSGGTPYTLGAGFPFGSLTSFSYGNQLITPGLKPELTRSIEAGIELGFFKRRVNTAATYYTQKSTNQSLSAGVSRASGFSGLLLNAGEVQNNGVEVELNLTPIQLDNSFIFRIGANYNYNANKVITITPDTHELALTTGGNANLFAIEGQPFPVLKGSYYTRDDQGRVIMDAAESPIDGSTIYFPHKSEDQKILGNTLPKNKYGFNSSISFKGLTLAAQAEYRTGYSVYNTIGENLDFTGGGQRSAQYGRKDFVFPNSSILGPDGKYTANTAGLTPGGSEFWANAAYNTTVAENYVTKGDFFKLRELSLSYTLPTEFLTKTKFVKGASLNLYGRNLYTWVPKANIYTDPEFSFGNSNSNAVGINNILQTPPTKFYGASISATF